MKLIVCVSNNNGMMFNQRRQSRDKILIKKIVEMTSGQLIVHPYSKTLFTENVEICENPFVSNNKYVFIEDPSLIKKEMVFDEIIICKWNRDYPSDQYFDYNMKNYKLVDKKDIVGNSHEEITIEKYLLKK